MVVEDQVVEEAEVEDTNIPEEEAPEEISETMAEESTEEVEDEEVEAEAEDSEEEEESDDRIVLIGDEPSEDSQEEHREAPGWVKSVRKKNRELEKTVKQLRREKEEREAAGNPKPARLEKPTLAKCGYDARKYEEQLTAFHMQRRKEEEQVAAQKAEWQEKQSNYVSLREKHKFKDFTYAEEIVSDSLNQTQQGIIVQGADDPALLVYALGKNPKKLQELSGVKDPVQFAFRLAKLEAQLKVTSKKAPAPEKRVSGAKTGGSTGNSEDVLNRLRDEAAKTGDYTKVTAYKRKLQNTKE